MSKKLQMPQVHTEDTGPDKKDLSVKDLSRANILKVIRDLLKFTVYDEEDIKVRGNEITINLCYDTKNSTDTYIEKLKERFPKNICVKNTQIKILIHNKNGSSCDKRKKHTIQENRGHGTCETSSTRNGTNTV